MRAVYIFVSSIFPLLIGAISSNADGFEAYSNRIKEGMSVSDVIAALGEPQGRLEMETRRETRLVYAKGSLRFVESRLTLEEDLNDDLSNESIADGSVKSDRAKKAKRGAIVSREDPNHAVKLESVLNEVMHTKASSIDNSTSPKVVPLPPGVPGSASMMAGGGAPPPPPMMPAPPYGSPPGGMYLQDEQTEENE